MGGQSHTGCPIFYFMKPIKLVVKLTQGETVLFDGVLEAYETLPNPKEALVNDIHKVADVIDSVVPFDEAEPRQYIEYKRDIGE